MATRERSLNARTLSRRSFLTSILSTAAMAAVKPSPPLISTMTGPVSCTSLGRTSIHEHVLSFVGPRLTDAGYTPIPDGLRAKSVDFAASLLNEAGKAGIQTIVDLTPYRPIDLYQQIARRTTVNIVPSTGFYRRAKIPAAWSSIEDEKAMEDLMHKEIVQGISGTSVRAGIMKVASEGAPLTDWEKKVFRAAGRVQKATGVPIATHSGPSSAPEQHAVLVENGADPRKIVLSHMDVGTHSDPARLKALLPLLESGSYFEVDTFGQDFYTPWSDLTAFLRFYCDAGFTKRLMISMDSNWHWENGEKIFEGGEPPGRDPNASRRTVAYLMTSAVPKLLKSGFNRTEIDTFMITNPRQYFCA